MGHGCYSAPVQHAFWGTECTDTKLPEWELRVTGVDVWSELQDEAAYPNPWAPPAWYTNKQDAPLGHGWVIRCTNGEWKWEEYKGLYVTPIYKGDKKVYGLNCSQYSNVGEAHMCYFADKAEDLQDFLNDFYPGKSYSTNVAVQQWM